MQGILGMYAFLNIILVKYPGSVLQIPPASSASPFPDFPVYLRPIPSFLNLLPLVMNPFFHNPGKHLPDLSREQTNMCYVFPVLPHVTLCKCSGRNPRPHLNGFPHCPDCLS